MINMQTRNFVLAFAIFSLLLAGTISAATVTSPIIDCDQDNAGLFNSPAYVGTALYNLTSNNGAYGGFIPIAILIVLMMFSILSVVYALGTAFGIESMINFAKQEFLEGIFNLIILVAVGISMASVAGALNFFMYIASYGISNTGGTPTFTLPPTAEGVFAGLCNYIGVNIVDVGFKNWLGIVINLFVVNTLESLNILVIPNSFGFAAQPFGGLTLLIQLLWDDQLAYFGIMFFGMFLIVLLFIIYYLFPIFFYIGLALRSFPWTRAAGGSFIGLFIAFYIIFPALMYPFLAIGTPGAGFCSTGSSLSGSSLCMPGNFITGSLTDLLSSLVNFNYGEAYYTDVTSFVVGFFYVGLNIFGLIIALLISYELIEKIGTILGAPSLNAQRALSRVL